MGVYPLWIAGRVQVVDPIPETHESYLGSHCALIHTCYRAMRHDFVVRFVFKGESHIQAWYEDDALPRDWRIELSENGWTTYQLVFPGFRLPSSWLQMDV